MFLALVVPARESRLALCGWWRIGELLGLEGGVKFIWRFRRGASSVVNAGSRGSQLAGSCRAQMVKSSVTAWEVGSLGGSLGRPARVWA